VEKRRFGRTGLDVSVLGFGCGAVGGLMIKGTPADQERAVARALELGINYFDTAQMYGNGESERNLGRVLQQLKPAVYVGTKVRLPPTERGNSMRNSRDSCSAVSTGSGISCVRSISSATPAIAGPSVRARATGSVLRVERPMSFNGRPPASRPTIGRVGKSGCQLMPPVR